jgi:glycosyltransferase involved in cell wall biosynthesis
VFETPIRRRLARQLTVVIPTRNRAAQLAVAVASVLASPLVTHPQQVVVVDDDSTDTTSQVAADFDASYVRVRCHGPSGSRNAGLALSDTPYVAFLDDDDAWLPGAMEAQADALDRDGNAAFAYGQARLATEEMEPLDQTWPVPPLASGIVPEQLYLNFPQIGAVLFRRDAIAEAGGFNPTMSFGEDAEMMLRLAARHPIVGVESVSLLYRQRLPSMARADYFWNGRAVVHWRPRNAGVGWPAFAKFESHTRGSFAWRFCQDAAWCVEHGSRQDALVCLYRALRISPAHTLLRQRQTVLSTLRAVAHGPLNSPESDARNRLVGVTNHSD